MDAHDDDKLLSLRQAGAPARESQLDLDSLLHPAQAFDHPDEIVSDPDLTLNEKRAILASWASDACAVDNAPALRRGPTGRTVTFDDILDALRALDREAAKARVKPAELRRRLRRWRGGRIDGGGIGVQ